VLPSSGQLTIQPFPTGSIVPANASLHGNMTLSVPLGTPVSTIPASANIFVAISTDAPPPQIPLRHGSLVQGVGLANGHDRPIETNKFYTNLMVSDQSMNVFTYPYSVHWVRGGGGVKSFGMGIQHIERSQTVYGDPDPESGAAICEL
jgi:endo-1,3(4)-beta-glucanase